MLDDFPPEPYFTEMSPLGVVIRTTKEYWDFIVREKHPSARKYEAPMRETVVNPDEMRQSKRNPNVYLYYKNIGKLFACVVAAHENGTGYIITAYLTDRIKEGVQIWKKH